MSLVQSLPASIDDATGGFARLLRPEIQGNRRGRRFWLRRREHTPDEVTVNRGTCEQERLFSRERGKSLVPQQRRGARLFPSQVKNTVNDSLPILFR
jgi:hypothetical protein